MKLRLILPALAALLFSTHIAAKTPKWYKAQKNSVVRIISYNADGSELARSNGFFISKDGTGITDLAVFKNAYSAITIDGNGIERPVQIILGADDMYDVAKFQVTPDKKLTVAGMPTGQEQETGSIVSALPYASKSFGECLQASVIKSMAVNDNRYYYNLALASDPELSGCPLFNDEGNAIGMIQAGNASDTISYALDPRFVADIEILAMSLDGRAYSDIHIRKSLPADAQQALAYIFIKESSLGTREYGQLLEDFLIQFPDNPDGLFNMGTYLIMETDSTQFERAQQLIDRSIELSEEKGRMHCDYANLIYSTVTQGIRTFDSWTLEKALEEISLALETDTVPTYYQLKGNIEYSMKNYTAALSSYRKLNASSLSSADTYLLAYTVCSRIENSEDQCIGLLDTAIMMLGTPLPPRSGTLFIERASLLQKQGRYREAVMDYYRYEDLTGSSSLNANFYYKRYQAEIQARMYEQALADIITARQLLPGDQTMTLEHASLLLRIGNPKAALPLLIDLVELFPDDTDVLRLLGVCYLQMDERPKGIPYLQKASDLGDATAARLLDPQ